MSSPTRSRLSATAYAGVDTTVYPNGAAFINGADTESDQAFKARFLLYIASLSKATEQAIASAIANVQQGLEFTYTENFDYNGTYDPGTFYVVVDDGTGAPSSTLLTAVQSAIEAVRALGIRFAVFAPVITTANVGMTITSATGYDHNTVAANVSLALAFSSTVRPAKRLPRPITRRRGLQRGGSNQCIVHTVEQRHLGHRRKP